MEKLIIFNQKGGVGKSTSVVNIAGCLAGNKKKKILVIDLDGQCTTSSYLRAIEGECDITLLDYIQESKTAQEIIQPVRFSKYSFKAHQNVLYDTNISLIASHKIFSKREFQDSFDNLDLFAKLFSEIDESQFDYCIMDAPGYISKFVESALRVANFIIVPAFADVDSLEGFSDLIDTKNRIRVESNNIDLDILGVFFTRHSAKISLKRQIRAQCVASMGDDIIFNSCIRDATGIGEARAMGLPINYYKPSAPVTEDYMTLTREILKRIKERRK